MREAEMVDLLFEKWLRDRNSRKIVWVTKDKKEIPIQDMSDSHLENAINRLEYVEEMRERYAEELGNRPF